MTLRRVFLSKRNQLTADKASNLDVAKYDIVGLYIYTLNQLFFRSLAKAACVLLPLLGITWVFGIFAINEEAVAFAWIFTILNSFQVCYLTHFLCDLCGAFICYRDCSFLFFMY